MRVTGIDDNPGANCREFVVDVPLMQEDGIILPAGYTVARELIRQFDALGVASDLGHNPVGLRADRVVISGSKIAASDYRQHITDCIEREPRAVKTNDYIGSCGSVIAKVREHMTAM